MFPEILFRENEKCDKSRTTNFYGMYSITLYRILTYLSNGSHLCRHNGQGNKFRKKFNYAKPTKLWLTIWEIVICYNNVKLGNCRREKNE